MMRDTWLAIPRAAWKRIVWKRIFIQLWDRKLEASKEGSNWSYRVLVALRARTVDDAAKPGWLFLVLFGLQGLCFKDSAKLGEGWVNGPGIVPNPCSLARPDSR